MTMRENDPDDGFLQIRLSINTRHNKYSNTVREYTLTFWSASNRFVMLPEPEPDPSQEL